jgi:hypothetical protein
LVVLLSLIVLLLLREAIWCLSRLGSVIAGRGEAGLLIQRGAESSWIWGVHRLLVIDVTWRHGREGRLQVVMRRGWIARRSGGGSLRTILFSSGNPFPFFLLRRPVLILLIVRNLVLKHHVNVEFKQGFIWFGFLVTQYIIAGYVSCLAFLSLGKLLFFVFVVHRHHRSGADCELLTLTNNRGDIGLRIFYF